MPARLNHHHPDAHRYGRAAGPASNSDDALSWAAASGMVTGYRVKEGSTVVATPTGTSATISGLAACSTHTYAVTRGQLCRRVGTVRHSRACGGA